MIVPTNDEGELELNRSFAERRKLDKLYKILRYIT
jgi:hypothetical protein